MTKVYHLIDVECGSEYRMTLPEILEHLNHVISYDETNWREGLAKFTTLEIKND